MIDRLIAWLDHVYYWLFLGMGGLLALTIFTYLASRYWSFFRGSLKMPLWMQRFMVGAEKISSFPRAIGRVLFVHPVKLVEEILITFIILAQKLRSRVALLIISLWAAIFIVILKPNADFQLFTGLATLIGASTFIMLRFMGMSQEDKKMEHEKMMKEVKAATTTEESKGETNV